MLQILDKKRRKNKKGIDFNSNFLDERNLNERKYLWA